MGFSLVGFGAGIAEGITEQIEEERKFSNLALQGRIERASVLKMQRDKEAAEIQKDLMAKREQLVAMGVDDPELQKVYLTSPTAFDAFSKAVSTGNVTDPKMFAKELVTYNKEKLFSGTPDDLIRNLVKGKVDAAAPATVGDEAKKSALAPAASTQQRRLEQMAAMKGMSLQDVAEAEAPRVETVSQTNAVVNMEKLQQLKPADDQLKQLEARYVALSSDKSYGPDHPETKNALYKYKVMEAAQSSLSPQQLDHNKALSKAMRIKFDKNLNVSNEDRKWADEYINNYEAHKRRQESSGKENDRIPSASTLSSLMSKAGDFAVQAKYGNKKDFALVPFDRNDPNSQKVLDYIGDDPVTRAEINRDRQNAALTIVANELKLSGGKVTDPRIRMALSAQGITIGENGEPVVMSTPQRPSASPSSTQPTRNPEEARKRLEAEITRPTQPRQATPSSFSGRGSAPTKAPSSQPSSDILIVDGKPENVTYINGKPAVKRGNDYFYLE